MAHGEVVVGNPQRVVGPHEREAEVPRNNARVLVAVIAAAGWAAIMRRVSFGNPYLELGPYAAIVLLVALMTDWRNLWPQLRVRYRLIGLGGAVGVATVLATYVAYDAAVALVPALEAPVLALYEEAGGESLATRLALVSVIIAAEEVLFRGAFFDYVRARRGTAVAAAASVIVYATVVGAEGSWIIVAIGLLMGGIWTLLKVRTGSLIPPLIAHLVWTPAVIILWPVV